MQYKFFISFSVLFPILFLFFRNTWMTNFSNVFLFPCRISVSSSLSACPSWHLICIFYSCVHKFSLFRIPLMQEKDA
ncbi:hypothetical protein HMPREF0239_03115 [Clostridium sp. ATCC BAA-442]|nr:hypothetical protein HMPREF0239_03115 [Clostridium sp. ATCC BAA-442]